MSYVLKICWILLCVTVISSVSAKIDFCSENIFDSSFNSNYLQFTKELSSSEYAVVSSFKSLHCCAKGYRSIQWLKDGKPYPWASEVSTFILYPEAANQTIYSQSLATIDHGNYTCQVTNDSQTIFNAINLKIFDLRYTDSPLSTYNMPAEHYVKRGDTARIFCEAFIGKNDLPDADYELTWTRPGMNESQVLKNPGVYKKDVLREDGQIIGSYFFIKNIKRSDYDDYICSVRNSIDQIRHMKTTIIELDWNGETKSFDVPWFKVVAIISVLLLLIIFISAIFEHILFSLLLFFKSFCPVQNYEHEKIYDVLICYMSTDSDLKTTVAVTLQKKYGYSVTSMQFVDPALAATASQSRSVLLIGSPAICNDEWTPKMIHSLLTYMTSLNSNVIFMPVKAIPDGELMKNEDGKNLEEILKKIFVVHFCGNRKSDIRLFWIKLRLALPTKKRNSRMESASAVSEQLVQAANQPVSTKVKFLTLTKSNEGVEVLV